MKRNHRIRNLNFNPQSWKMYYLVKSKGICTGKNSTLARIIGIQRILGTSERHNWLISKCMKAKLVQPFGNQSPMASLLNYNLDLTLLLLSWRVKVDWNQVPILKFEKVSVCHTSPWTFCKLVWTTMTYHHKHNLYRETSRKSLEK